VWTSIQGFPSFKVKIDITSKFSPQVCDNVVVAKMSVITSVDLYLFSEENHSDHLLLLSFID